MPNIRRASPQPAVDAGVHGPIIGKDHPALRLEAAEVLDDSRLFSLAQDRNQVKEDLWALAQDPVSVQLPTENVYDYLFRLALELLGTKYHGKEDRSDEAYCDWMSYATFDVITSWPVAHSAMQDGIRIYNNPQRSVDLASVYSDLSSDYVSCVEEEPIRAYFRQLMEMIGKLLGGLPADYQLAKKEEKFSLYCQVKEGYTERRFVGFFKPKVERKVSERIPTYVSSDGDQPALKHLRTR